MVELQRDGRTDPALLEALVARAAGGDRQAQDELMRHYWPLILKVVRSRLARLPSASQREDAFDVTQDAALRILRDLHAQGFRGRDQFRAWMKRIADAAAIDRHRYHSAQRRSPKREAGSAADLARPTPARSPESVIDAGRDSEQVRRALESLDHDLAAAVWMHHSGYTYAEIADTLGLNAEQVRKRIARAEVKLMGLMAKV